MIKRVELPNGEVADFPAEMDDAEIAAVLSKEFPAPKKIDTAKASVMKNESSAKNTSPIRPEYVDSVKQQYDNASPEQRKAMEKDKNSVAGRIAAERGVNYSKMDLRAKPSATDSAINRLMNKPVNGIEMPKIVGTTNTADGRKEAPKAMAKPKEIFRSRTGTEIAKDTALDVGIGVTNIVGAIPNMVSPEGEFAGKTRETAEALRGMQSDPMQQQIERVNQRIEQAGTQGGLDGAADQFGQALREYGDNPALAASLIVQNLPSFIPGLAVGKLAQMAPKVLPSLKFLASKGVPLTAAAITNAVMNAGGARGEAYDDLLETQLQKNVPKSVAEDRAKEGSIIPGAIGFGTGLISGGSGLEGALFGKASSGAIRRAASEFASEQAEEVLPKIATNLEASQYDDRSALKDVGRTVAETSISSLPTTAGSAAVDVWNATKEKKLADFLGDTKDASPELLKAKNTLEKIAADKVGQQMAKVDQQTGEVIDQAQPGQVKVTFPNGDVIAGQAVATFEEDGRNFTKVVSDSGEAYVLADDEAMIEPFTQSAQPGEPGEGSDGATQTAPETPALETKADEEVQPIDQPTAQAATVPDGPDLASMSDDDLAMMVKNAQDPKVRQQIAAERRKRREKMLAEQAELAKSETQQSQAPVVQPSPSLNDSEKPAEAPKDKKYFDKLTVADMTDEELEQAKQFYPEGSKRQASIAKQQQKRKGANVTGNVSSEKAPISGDSPVFAENRKAMANFKVGDEVEFTQPGKYTQPDGSVKDGLVVRGKIEKIQDKEQGIFQVGNYSVHARRLLKVKAPTKTEQLESTGLTSKQEEILTPGQRAKQREADEAEQLKVINQVVMGSQVLKDIGVDKEALALAERIKAMPGKPEAEQAGKLLLSYVKGREDDAKAGRKADPAFFTENFAKKISTLLDTADNGKGKKQYTPVDLDQWKKEHPDLSAEGFTDALPEGLVAEGLRVLNETNQKLADMGYDPSPESVRILKEKRNSLPQEVQDLLEKRNVMTWLSVVARRRVKDQREGKDNTARVLDRTERQTMEMYGIDPKQFPGVDSRVKLQDGNEKGQYKSGGEDTRQQDDTAAQWTRTPTVQREAILKQAGLSDALKNKAFEDIGGPGQQKIARVMNGQAAKPTIKKGTILFDKNGTDYRIDSEKIGEVTLTKNVDKLSEQTVKMDSDTFNRLVRENEQFLADSKAANTPKETSLLEQIEQLESTAVPVTSEATMAKAKELTALNEKLYAQDPKARDWFAKRPNESTLQGPRRGGITRAGGQKVGVTYAVYSYGKTVRVRIVADDGKFVDDSSYQHPENITATRVQAAIRGATYNIGPEPTKGNELSLEQLESMLDKAQAEYESQGMVKDARTGSKIRDLESSIEKIKRPEIFKAVGNVPKYSQVVGRALDFNAAKGGEEGTIRSALKNQGVVEPSLSDMTNRVLEAIGVQKPAPSKSELSEKDEFLAALEQIRQELPEGYSIQSQGSSLSLMENGKFAVNGLNKTVAGAQEALRQAKLRAKKDEPVSDSKAINDFLTGKRDDAPTIEEVKAEQSSQFANNTIFTADKVQAARDLLKKKLGQLNSGIDPEIMQAGITIAGGYIESGVRKFADFSRAMVADFGENIRPFLRSFYEGARYYPGLDNTGMSSAAEIEALEKSQSSTKTLNTPEGRFAVAQQIADFFVGGGKFDTIVQARKKIAEITGQRVEAATSEAKMADEVVETAVVLAAREIVDSGRKMGRNKFLIYDRLVDLYSRQPNLSVRTSTSVSEQAYSTPAPLAYLASELAGITDKSKVYEPSAGNGMLLVGADVKNSIANELNDYRVSSLSRVLDGAQIQNQDATQWAPSARSVDAVIQNPPFGTVKDESGQTLKFEIAPDYVTSEIDHAIVFKSLEAMKDDGRAVLIVGGTMAKDEEARAQDYRGKSKRSFYFNLYNQYNVVDHFTVSGSMYSKQGASYPVDVIVIDGRGKSNRDLPAASVPVIIQNYTELKGKLDENRSVDTAKNDGTSRTDNGGNPAGQGDGKNVAGSTQGQSEQNGRAGTGIDARNQSSIGSDGDSNVAGQPERSGSISGGRESESQNASDAGPVGGRSIPDSGNGEGKQPGAGSTRRNGPPKLDGVSTVTGERQQSGLSDRRGQEQETESQVAYSPKSGASSVGTLVPRAMADSIQKSLEKIQQAKGDIDEFVAKSLNMPVKTVRSNFSAEQIDALALAIDNAQKGSGFIIGDQTGIGKGRVVAAMIRYALVSGKTPVFVTEKPNLYSDMIRDLDDIGLTDELKLDTPTPKILMTNGSEKVPYTLIRTVNGEPVENNLVLKPPKTGKALDDVLKQMRESESLGDYKVIFTTYSQLQTVKGAATERMNFVRAFGTGGYMIFDESHNAGGSGEPTQARSKEQREKAKAGESLVEGRAAFVRNMVEASDGSFFSSATYAKRPDVMDLYSSTNMRLAVDNISELGSAIKDGGVPMQQVVANMLTQDGQYIRRERTFAGVSYETKEAAVDLQTAEAMALAMRSILAFSRAKDVVVKQVQKDLDKQGAVAQSFQTAKTQVESANFGAIMHNLIDQMLLALKAKQSVDFAIERLKAGEKVVLTVSNTMGSFLKEYADQEGLSKGDVVTMNFGDMYLRYLEKQLEITIKLPNGETKKEKLTPNALGPTVHGQYLKIREQILNSNFGQAPISPIDYMKSEIAKAGYRADEITGRTIALDYSAGEPTLTTRQATIRQRVNAVSGFNNGEIDVLILNQAGSTGLSLHASSKFKDKRKRHMIIVQAEKNIDTHMQMLGRVHRTGQIIAPAYSQMMAAIPAEMRPAAVLMKKMASLNANTTASRKSSVTAEGVVDFINDYGGQVAAEFLQDNPDVWRSLGGEKVIAVPENPNEANEDLIRKLTGYIPVLPIKKQEEIYKDLIDRYEQLLERETSMGTNKLEAAAMDLDAKVLSSEAINESKDVDSIFAKPAYMEQVSVKRTVKPLTSDELKAAIEKSLEGKSAQQFNADFEKEIRANVEQFIAEKTKDFGEGEDDLLRKSEFTVSMNSNLAKIQNILALYRIGDPITMKIGEEGTIVYGVITNISKKGKSQSPAANSSYALTLALGNGDAKSIMLPFSKIGTTYSLEKTPRVNYYNPASQQFEMTPVMEIFDKGSMVRREKRWMVTGNILAGYSQYKGQITSYTKEDGTIGQGILMSRQFDFAKAKAAAPYQFKSASEAIEFMRSTPYNQIKSKNDLVRVSMNYGRVVMTVPASKKEGGDYYLDSKLRQIIGQDFVKSGQSMQARFETNNLQAVFEHLQASKGDKFVAATHNDVAKKMFERKPDDNGQMPNTQRVYSIRGNTREFSRIRKLFSNGKLTEASVPKLFERLIENRKVSVTASGEMSLSVKQMSAVMQWLFDRNPNIEKSLVEIIFDGTLERHVGGFYDSGTRKIVLNANRGSAVIGVHEVMHHTERMLPPDVQAKIRELWLRDWNKAFTKGDAETKEFLLNMAGASLGDDIAYEKVVEAFNGEKFKVADWYSLFSPSEYWAENGADYMLARATESWVQKANRWMREFVAFLKNKLGLSDDYYLIKAFNYVLNQADGDFKSSTLIKDSVDTGFENGRLFSLTNTSAQRMFNAKEIDALNVPAYKSREKLMEMRITDFLDLAEKGIDREKLSSTKALVEKGTPFNTLPFLQFDADGRVDGHEGRHRARALMAAGYKTMPVILRSANIRWSQQDNPQGFDYVQAWPTKLKAQKNATNPRFYIDFPVKREDSMKPYLATDGLDPNSPKKTRSLQSKDMAMKELATVFKEQTGDSIAVASTKLAGQEVRRAAGKVEADLYTSEQVQMIDQWEAMRNPSSKYLFHTTSAANLQSILQNGLKPGSKQRFEGVGNGQLSFGANEATSAYYSQQGDMMLRVSNKFEFSALNPDLLAGNGAYTTPDTIPASALEVKDGSKWVPLTDYAKRKNRVMSLQQKEAAEDVAQSAVQIIDRQQKLAKDLNRFESMAVHPRTIASFNKEFVPVYQAAVEQFEKRDQINAELTRAMTDYTELTDAQKQAVNKVLERGRLEGVNYKDAEQANLSFEEFKGYVAARNTMNIALDMFKAQFIREQGFDPEKIKTEKQILDLINDAMPESMKAAIKRAAEVIREIEQAKRQGYVPFTRYGQIGVYVKDADGNTLHFEKVEIDGIKDKLRRAVGKDKVIENIPAVRELMAKLAKRYPDADRIGAFEVGKQTKEEVNLADLDRLANVAEIDTDVWSEVSEALKMAAKAKGFRKHFFGSANVPGYSKDFERGLADYIVGISGYLARRQYNQKFDDAIAGVPTTMPNLKAYADKYREYINSPTEEWQGIRQAAFLYYIAGNLSTAIVNLSQQFMSAAYLSQFATLGQAKVQLARANKDTLAMFNPTLELFDPNKAPEDVRELVKKAWDSGLFVPLQTYENLGTAHNRSKVMRGMNEKVRKGIEIAALSFTAAERLNRIATFIATVRMAKAEKFKDQAAKVLKGNPLARAEMRGGDFAYKMAELVIDETHYRMGKVNRPSFMRGIGAPITQFKSFMFQTLELMVRTAALNGPEGKRATLYILAVFLILGGSFGLPFAESLTELAEAAYKKATGEEVDLKAEARLSLAKSVGPKAAEVITSGAGPLVGVDLQSKAGMGDVVPMTVSDVLGIPVALTFGRLGDAMMYAKQERYEAMMGALLPNFAGNMLQAYEWGTDGVRKKTTGQMVIKPEELSGMQLAGKSIGFTPSEVTAIRSAEYAISRENNKLKDKAASFHGRLGKAYADIQLAQSADEVRELEQKVSEILAEVAEYNDGKELSDQLLLNDSSIRQAIEREMLGRFANDKRIRKAARGKAGEIREAFTGQYAE